MSKKIIIFIFISLLNILFGYFIFSNKIDFYSNYNFKNTLCLQLSKSTNKCCKLTDNFINNKEININLHYKDKIYYLNLNNMHKVNSFIIVENKYKSVHKLDYKNIVFQITKLKKWGFDNNTIFNYIFAPFKNDITNFIYSINYNPIDANVIFNRELNKFEYTNDFDGLEIDTNKLKDEIINSLLKDNNIDIQIKTKPIKANITKQQLLANFKKQSSFSTYYGNSNSERKNNIKLACNALHGFEVLPNQIFSFNEAIGKRNIENGYKEANIIVDGQFVKGVGGGVCQVSSTLYNALLLANIKPIEVHKHSLPVSYVKPGLDAMVSWSTADLKFKNTTDTSIFITSNCNGYNLTFNIYGNTKQPETIIKTESKIIKTIPHKGDKTLPDTQGKYIDRITYKGEFVREKPPKDGYIAHVYLNTYKNDVLIKQELIRDVMYEPQFGLVYEGTKDPPEENIIL